jgi:hypothetical protein
MRAVAMKLHTKEQAPKEGRAERKPESKPMPQARGCGARRAASVCGTKASDVPTR